MQAMEAVTPVVKSCPSGLTRPSTRTNLTAFGATALSTFRCIPFAASIARQTLFRQPIWIIRDGIRLLAPKDLQESDFSYERFFEGGRVGILIQVVNDNGGITIIPETHANFILFSQQHCLRPIIDPVPDRTISLVIRNDYIHEAKLNAVVEAVKRIIPGALLDNVIRKGWLAL